MLARIFYPFYYPVDSLLLFRRNNRTAMTHDAFGPYARARGIPLPPGRASRPSRFCSPGTRTSTSSARGGDELKPWCLWSARPIRSRDPEAYVAWQAHLESWRTAQEFMSRARAMPAACQRIVVRTATQIVSDYRKALAAALALAGGRVGFGHGPRCLGRAGPRGAGHPVARVTRPIIQVRLLDAESPITIRLLRADILDVDVLAQRLGARRSRAKHPRLRR